MLTAHALVWTAGAEDAIRRPDSSDVTGTRAFQRHCADQLESVVSLVRREEAGAPISPRDRKTLRSLIIMNVHYKDVVARLVRRGVCSAADFEWTSNMRYYADGDYDSMDDGGRVRLEMVGTRLDYAFEYLGNFDRLVVTPMTERCLRTLACALRMNLGGAPEGPAGSGKTETCKDLAKAVAKQCVVFNCSDGIDYRSVIYLL